MSQHRPDGYHALTPYLIVPDGNAAIAFYERAFGARETMRLSTPDGGVAHADLVVGDSHFMLAGVTPEMNVATPTDEQWPMVSLALYVEDCDAAFEQAVAAGCVVEQAPEDMFWGDRMAKLRDPFGHRWSLLTLFAEIPVEEVQEKMEAMFAGG